MSIILLFITLFYVALSTPNTDHELDVNKYLGHWYQVYGAPSNFIFQGYGTCITADYGAMDNGQVSVLNSQVNLNNELEQIDGYAYYKNVSEPGKLTVHLDGVPIDAPYWVVKLGEVENDQYQYSIITSPSGVSLWVLARDVNEFFEYYDDEVRSFLDQNNFSYLTIEQEYCYDNPHEAWIRKHGNLDGCCGCDCHCSECGGACAPC